MISLPPFEEAAIPSIAEKHSFFQHQARKYHQENKELSGKLRAFKERVAINQKNYDAIYHILYHLQHHNQEEKRSRTKGTTSKLDVFIEEFTHLFEVDSASVIYLNQPHLRRFSNKATKTYSYCDFWDDSMQDLFDKNEISFAPIEQVISRKLFVKPTIKSAGLIPFQVERKPVNFCGRRKRYTLVHHPAVFAFGSMDESRFLPDSSYHLDLLWLLQQILKSL